MNDKNSAYIIDSMLDACAVLKVMMQDLSPSRYYKTSELAKMFPQFTDNKIYRILKTFEQAGFVEKSPNERAAFKIGHDLLYLSHRYLNRLYEEHEKIRNEINSFR